MANFPSLTPSSRAYSPGFYPHRRVSLMNGMDVAVRSSNAVVGSSLKLTFRGLTEAEALQVVSHYITQQGRFIAFSIPTSILSGTTDVWITAENHLWRYAGSPGIVDSCGLRDVTVDLEMVKAPTI